MRKSARLTTCLVLSALALLLACSSPPPPRTYASQDECPGGVFAGGDASEAEIHAEMIHYETPQYPAVAQMAGLEGVVWVRALVSTLGNIVEAAVYKSSGIDSLDRAALDAAPRCRFTPARKNGAPVCMWVSYKVTFALTDKSKF